MAKDKEIKVNVEDLEEAPRRQDDDAVEDKEEVSGNQEARGSDGSAVDGSDHRGKETSAELSAEEKLARLEDKLLRTMAEFDNYRKRSLQQFEQIRNTAIDDLLLEILEVVDNFERALQHAEENSGDDALLKGTELIYNQLRGVLARRNVKAIESLGRPFDPNLHDAMMQTASEEFDEGTVAIEISKGYMVGDRVLRHAKVAVSTGPAADSGDESDTN